MTRRPDEPLLKLRLVFGPDEMIGPGKAELLERIEKTGSIAAAGREMGMSYKRAWMLVETMNDMFRDPVVVSSRGGARGGGAKVTDVRFAVLKEYRALEWLTRDSGKPHVQKLQSLLSDTSEKK